MGDLVFIAYMCLLSLAFLAGAARFRFLSRADKWICVLLLLTIISEALARWLIYRQHNNMILWHIYSPLELLLICCYFNETVEKLKSKNAGLWLGVAGLFFACINTAFFQSADGLNTSFLLFEAIGVIIMSLVSYHDLLGKDTLPLQTSAQFWISTAFLFYWFFSFVQWGLYKLLQGDATAYKPVLYLLWMFNLCFYLVLAFVFLRYPKMVRSGDAG